MIPRMHISANIVCLRLAVEHQQVVDQLRHLRVGRQRRGRRLASCGDGLARARFRHVDRQDKRKIRDRAARDARACPRPWCASRRALRSPVPAVSVREMRSPASTKNLVGSRPESATRTSVSNFGAGHRDVDLEFRRATRSAAVSDSGDVDRATPGRWRRCARRCPCSRMRSTPASSSSLSPVASLTESPS